MNGNKNCVHSQLLLLLLLLLLPLLLLLLRGGYRISEREGGAVRVTVKY